MKYYRLELKGKVVESGNIMERIPFVDQDINFALDRFYILKERLLRRKKLKRILIRAHSDFRAYPAQLEEIRDCLRQLRNHDKDLYFYAKNYSLKELFLASACQNRIIPDGGAINYYGLALENVYWKNLFDQLEIRADVYRKGRFKGAADSFRVSDMDEAQKEALTLLLQRICEALEQTAAADLQGGHDLIADLKTGTFVTAREALKRGIVSRVDSFHNLLKSWEGEKVKKDRLFGKKLAVGRGKKIAVLSFDGGIIDGDNKKHPLLGNFCGDDYFVDQIDRLAGNKAFKAVIFKVNSGGGSASASAEIAGALERLGQKKPLMVVQGGVAASGGYYISSPGEKIFTRHSTITGSIGVIYLLFYARPFLEKRGVTHAEVKNGQYADLFSSWRERGESENRMIMDHIDYIYRTFTGRVARDRDLAESEVDAVGQGRIWSGYDALQARICDFIGGLDSAVAFLQEKEDLGPVRLEFFPKPRRGLLRVLLGARRAGGATLKDVRELLGIPQGLNRRPLYYCEELLVLDLRL